MEISVAPMMGITTKHCRYFFRLLSPKIKLYTEMVTTGAIIYGDKKRFLDFHPLEKPIVLQLGGSNPKALVLAAQHAEEAGFDEINLNVGCPSDRVQAGRFGACLMKEPELVADCIASMQTAVNIPVTVKTRIGVDEFEGKDFFHHFIKTVEQAHCKTFIIHARKAWLKGLSPKDNREIPPLNYPMVYQLKKHFPHLNIIVNGGINTLSAVRDHLSFVDGVMLGRTALHNPYLLAEISEQLLQTTQITRTAVVNQYMQYAAIAYTKGATLPALLKPLFNLYNGQPGAKAWRRFLTELLTKNQKNALSAVVRYTSTV